MVTTAFAVTLFGTQLLSLLFKGKVTKFAWGMSSFYCGVAAFLSLCVFSWLGFVGFLAATIAYATLARNTAK